MGQNIIAGIFGAIIGGIVLYFVLGIPSEMRGLDRRLAMLEGQFVTFTTLRKEFEALQSKVDEVQSTITKKSTPRQVDLRLTGAAGSSSRWGSGWIDLEETMDFKKGDKLRLSIGGTARKIKVRLLPRGQSPDSTAGILPGDVAVPPNKIVEVELRSDRPNISQISVHGGSNPWGAYPLGGENGPATLEKAELIRP